MKHRFFDFRKRQLLCGTEGRADTDLFPVHRGLPSEPPVSKGPSDQGVDHIKDLQHYMSVRDRIGVKAPHCEDVHNTDQRDRHCVPDLQHRKVLQARHCILFYLNSHDFLLFSYLAFIMVFWHFFSRKALNWLGVPL